MVIIEEAVSDKLLTASAITLTDEIKSPMDIFIMVNITFIIRPTIEARYPTLILVALLL